MPALPEDGSMCWANGTHFSRHSASARESATGAARGGAEPALVRPRSPRGHRGSVGSTGARPESMRAIAFRASWRIGETVGAAVLARARRSRSSPAGGARGRVHDRTSATGREVVGTPRGMEVQPGSLEEPSADGGVGLLVGGSVLEVDGKPLVRAREENAPSRTGDTLELASEACTLASPVRSEGEVARHGPDVLDDAQSQHGVEAVVGERNRQAVTDDERRGVAT